jgi:hypothetical protein
MIRKNGEEIATSVEMVVEKVSWGYCCCTFGAKSQLA